eukprot:s329_g8.t1
MLIESSWASIIGLLKVDAAGGTSKLTVDTLQEALQMDVLVGVVLFFHCHVLSQGGRLYSTNDICRQLEEIEGDSPPPDEGAADTSPDVEVAMEPRGRLRSTKAAIPLSDDERLRLHAFIERFDNAGSLEPTLRVVASEVDSFFPFQACKVLQRLAKRFGAAAAGDRRVAQLASRCAATMPGADGVLGDCGPISLATAWHAFEVLQFEPAECLAKLTEQVLQRTSECDAPEVAIVLHAAATLQFPTRDALFKELLEHVRSNEGKFSARHLAVCFHAAAKVGLRDEALCEIVARRFSHHIEDTDALALTSAVYACGLVAHPDVDITCALQLSGRRLEPQQVSNMVYTFGKLGFKKEEVLLRCAEFAILLEDFWRFKTQELDNLTYGMALLKYRHDPYLNALAGHLVEGGRVLQLDAQSLVSMAYSTGLLGFANPVMLRALGDQAIPKLQRFKAEEFSIMVYSMGLLNFRHHDLLSAMVQDRPPGTFLKQRCPRFTTQNMSNLLHGLGLVTFDRDDDFVRGVADHLASRLGEATGQDIANPVTALMRMSSPLPLRDFTPQEIANTIYGFDALQVFDHILFEQVKTETLKRVEDLDFIPQEAANVLWACAKQGFGNVEFFEEILGRCLPFAEAVKPTPGLRETLSGPSALSASTPLLCTDGAGVQTPFLEQDLCLPDFPGPGRWPAAWDLYQVGPDYTQELLEAVGVERSGANEAAVQSLMDHYIGEAQDSLLSRYGDKLLISVLPAARWVSSHLAFRIFPASGAAAVVQDTGVVEPAHPKGDDEANQRRYRADRWREAVEPAPPGSNGHAPFRPVLLSTFLGNWRHRHTELVALDTVVDAALKAVAEGKWRWTPDFWESLCGEVPGDSSSLSSSLGSGVASIVATERALAALKDDGSVVAWGHASYGGDASSASSFLTSGVANIFSTGYALTALKDDGCVVAWGFSSYGAPPSHLLASGVTNIFWNTAAFVALKDDGSLAIWGSPNWGGDSSSVASFLTSRVQEVFSTRFVKNLGSIITWRDPEHGGDSSSVQGKFLTWTTTAGARATLLAC